MQVFESLLSVQFEESSTFPEMPSGLELEETHPGILLPRSPLTSLAGRLDLSTRRCQTRVVKRLTMAKGIYERAEDVAAGRRVASGAELLELVRAVNPTGRELPAKTESERYRLKSRSIGDAEPLRFAAVIGDRIQSGASLRLRRIADVRDRGGRGHGGGVVSPRIPRAASRDSCRFHSAARASRPARSSSMSSMLRPPRGIGAMSFGRRTGCVAVAASGQFFGSLLDSLGLTKAVERLTRKKRASRRVKKRSAGQTAAPRTRGADFRRRK